MTKSEGMDQEGKPQQNAGIPRRWILTGGTAIAAVAALGGAGAYIVSRLGWPGYGPSRGIGTTNAKVARSASIVYQIAREDGPGKINFTDTRWNVYGADLGHMFLHNGKLYMVFGDTFGSPAAADFFSQSHADWRSNTMAWLHPPHSPAQGLLFDGMITDTPGHAKELLSSKKVSGDEMTVIPTYGVSVGARMLLHYMSVREWGQPGHWTLNNSGLAYSDDQGQTWTKDQQLIWRGDSNFGQVAIVEEKDYLYFFGIPGGRYGGVQLARVQPRAILNSAAYQYWDGRTWQTNAISSAATIVPAPVGELSVRWNSYYKKWLMMYLNDPQGHIVLRTAANLTGPWSDEKIIVTAASYPQLYAPYITPLWNDGPDIYFTMSVYGPYCVYLMRVPSLSL